MAKTYRDIDELKDEIEGLPNVVRDITHKIDTDKLVKKIDRKIERDLSNRSNKII